MSERPSGSTRLDYRTRYLKMKSVLQDRVTGLPAFPLLFDRLRTLLESRRGLGVIHLEVAELEMVESLYGWQVFDGVVARVARTLRRAVGRELPSSALLALNGVAGDRFVLFVPERENGKESDDVYLAGVTEKVRRMVETALDDEALAGLNPRLRVRAGHARLTENPFYRFERCVYAAVSEARAAPARHERRRELSWGDELRGIIRGGEVRTLFQPVVELATRRVVGHEALARGPRDSMFETPRTLFACSDRVGMADELDRLCIDTALGAATDLPRRGKLFLNVLEASLEGKETGRDGLRSSLERHDLEPCDLVLEVSERLAGTDPGAFVTALRRFKAAGFEIALDDIGTGRAGLKVIERIEPDYLKIDSCLVRNLHESLMQQEVLLTLVDLADRIGGAVIGEGVESEAEAGALADGGARYGQGHLFAVPADPRTMRTRAVPEL